MTTEDGGDAATLDPIRARRHQLFASLAGAVVLAAALVLVAPAGAGPVTCVRTRVGTGSAVVGAALTPGGDLWFGLQGDDPKVGSVGADGELTLHDLDAEPLDVLLGPDGAIWAVTADSEVRRWTTAGAPLATIGGVPAGNLFVGPDGNVWGFQTNGSTLYRITPAGAVTSFFMEFAAFEAAVAGPDGRIWSVGGNGLDPQLRAFSADGVWAFANPASDDDLVTLDRDFVDRIVVGPNGALWVGATQELGRVGANMSVSWVTGSLQLSAIAGDATGVWAYDPNVGFLSSGGGLQLEHHGWTTQGSAPSELAIDDGQVWGTSTGEGAIPKPLYALRCPEIATPPFADVPLHHPFVSEIAWMAETGVSTGFGNGTYRPSASVSRAAMSAFMYRLADADFDAPPTARFSDVAVDHPFFREIEWMAEEGITTGFGNSTYRPGAAVTRAAMSAFMYRLAGEPDVDEPPFPGPFSDVRPDHPFYGPIAWMSDFGISTGFANGTYRPSASVSRAAMSAFMQRLTEVQGTPLNG